MNFYEQFGDYSLNSGCTSCMVLIAGNQIICINIGDSRAVLSRKGRAVSLSVDHKPYSPAEQQRIKEAGGFVSLNRVQGKLAVSRAFGDFFYKPVSQKGDSNYAADIVISQPEIRVHTLGTLTH